MSADRLLELFGRGELRLYDGGQTNYISLRAPASMSGAHSFVLPDESGSSGQVLTTDGAGNFFWGNGTASLQSAYDAAPDILIGAEGPVNVNKATGGEALLIRAGTSGDPYLRMTAGASEARLTIVAGGAFRVGTVSAHSLELRTNNATRLTVNSAGELGVNVAPETGILMKLNGSISISNDAYYRSKETGGANRNVIGLDSSNRLAIGDASTATALFLNSGNVGIGTIGPQTALEVAKDAAVPLYLRRPTNAAANECNLVFLTETGAEANGNFLGAIKCVITDDDPLKSKIEFRVNAGDNPAAVMTLTDDLRVGIGHTAPTTKLLVQNTGGILCAKFVQQTSASVCVGIQQETEQVALEVDKTQGGSSHAIFISNSGTGDDIRSNSGAKLTVAGEWTNASSRRLKENFETDASVLEKARRLPISRYNYKRTPGRKAFGPVAEDFHATFGLGDDQTISPLDVASIALACVKTLDERVQELEARCRL